MAIIGAKGKDKVLRFDGYALYWLEKVGFGRYDIPVGNAGLPVFAVDALDITLPERGVDGYFQVGEGAWWRDSTTGAEEATEPDTDFCTAFTARHQDEFVALYGAVKAARAQWPERGTVLEIVAAGAMTLPLRVADLHMLEGAELRQQFALGEITEEELERRETEVDDRGWADVERGISRNVAPFGSWPRRQGQDD